MAHTTALTRRIQALDFAILEMELFLDTHPYDQKALRARGVYRKRRKEAIAEYERTYGPYIVTTDNVSSRDNNWEWIEGPWPWENREEA